jgi:hypothetical protein
MVISEIREGLGNQLFMYAAGRALSLEHGVPLVLDISWFRKWQGLYRFWHRRPFLLDRFNIAGEIRSDSVAEAHAAHLFRQTQWQFHPEFLAFDGIKALIGYWQSEKYFLGKHDRIRADLQVRDPALLARARTALQAAVGGTDRPVVSVHYRRGDSLRYVRMGVLGKLPPDYHARAMRQFPDDALFVMFSDDPRWCRRHFRDPNIRHFRDRDPVVSFLAMQLCDHHIITNSTFSWWAAWLGEGAGKHIVAPHGDCWLGPVHADYDKRDMVPERWTILPAA